MRRQTCLVALIGIMVIATPAVAQKKGDLGLSMAFPAAVGAQWHATDRVAARVTVNYERSSTDTEIAIPVPVGIVPTETTIVSSSVSVGLSGLFFLRNGGGVSAFVSPSYAYTHSTADRNPDVSGLSDGGLASHAFGGSFGVQYTPNRKFGVFGEAGLEYQRHDSTPGSVITRSRIFGTRAGVGVILYFRTS